MAKTIAGHGAKMKSFGYVCEIRGCNAIAKRGMVSTLKYPTLLPHLKPDESRHGTLVRLCLAHAQEFGVEEEATAVSGQPELIVISVLHAKCSLHSSCKWESIIVRRGKRSNAQLKKKHETEFARHVKTHHTASV
jgi:hypothetical protein